MKSRQVRKLLEEMKETIIKDKKKVCAIHSEDYFYGMIEALNIFKNKYEDKVKRIEKDRLLDNEAKQEKSVLGEKHG